MDVKKIALLLAGGVLGLGAVVVIAGFVLPGTWYVERTVVIAAPPEVIHRFVGDLHAWEQWTAWSPSRDPSLVAVVTGEGVGSEMNWESAEFGSGRVQLLSSDPASGIAYHLWFDGQEPPSTGKVAYTAEGTGTRVTWTSDGDVGSNPISHFVVPMLEGYMGPDFEQGLAQLQVKAEAKAAELKLVEEAATKAAELEAAMAAERQAAIDAGIAAEAGGAPGVAEPPETGVAPTAPKIP